MVGALAVALPIQQHQRVVQTDYAFVSGQAGETKHVTAALADQLIDYLRQHWQFRWTVQHAGTAVIGKRPIAQESIARGAVGGRRAASEAGRAAGLADGVGGVVEGKGRIGARRDAGALIEVVVDGVVGGDALLADSGGAFEAGSSAVEAVCRGRVEAGGTDPQAAIVVAVVVSSRVAAQTASA